MFFIKDSLIKKFKMPNIHELFQSYGITGIPAIDTLILAHVIPFAITYITFVFTFLKDYMANVIFGKMEGFYAEVKSKIIGSVDIRLCLSEDKHIYPIVKNIIFSNNVQQDPINAKVIAMLALITDSKKNKKFYDKNEVYDLYSDASHKLIFEKRIDHGSSITKKIFKYLDYYIIVSLNKKTDFSHFYKNLTEELDNSKTDSKNTPKDESQIPKEHFILFEAVRANNDAVKDNEIITKFLHDRFKIESKIPYKYTLIIKNSILMSKLRNNSNFINEDSCSAELKISDGIVAFLNNPQVKEFYNGEQHLPCDSLASKENNIPSQVLLDIKSNSLNVSKLSQNISIVDSTEAVKGNFFSASFKSILTYFFGNIFVNYNIIRYFFYFKENKIILCFCVEDKEKMGCTWRICIVSFKETLQKNGLVQILTDLLQNKNMQSQLSENICINTYTKTGWQMLECDNRSYDSIYLPILKKNLITSEMDKFMCYEKIYKAINTPYKKGFLLYGPPGTGKTSLVRAMAHAYKLPIYIIDVNSTEVDDESIVSILNSISGEGNRIVLFEDIDSAFSNKEELKYQLKTETVKKDHDSNQKTKSNKENSSQDSYSMKPLEEKKNKFLTYSGLLNALDGVSTSQHGTIIIMTTNYKEKLGDALIRPGRIDFSIELTFCDHHQIVEMTTNIITKSYDIINNITLGSENTISTKNTEMSIHKQIIFKNPYNKSQLDLKIQEFADNLVCDQYLSNVKPCELQVYILKYLDNIQCIFDNYKELL